MCRGTLSLHPLRVILGLTPSAPNPSFGLYMPAAPSSSVSDPEWALFWTFSYETKPYKTLLVTFFLGKVPWWAVLTAARRESCDRIESWGERKGDDWGPESVERVDRSELVLIPRSVIILVIAAQLTLPWIP